jgi:hypothetical protein
VERWRRLRLQQRGRPGLEPAGWRAPLRDALDWLRDNLAPRLRGECHRLLRDPWAARDEYIAVILDRSPERGNRVFDEHAAPALTERSERLALRLLELQRHAMLMYTSCGWFFDELSGIETVQVLQYAGRALQLAEILFGEDLEPAFLERLARARAATFPSTATDGIIYEKFVKPAVVRPRVAGRALRGQLALRDVYPSRRASTGAPSPGKHHAKCSRPGRPN